MHSWRTTRGARVPCPARTLCRRALSTPPPPPGRQMFTAIIAIIRRRRNPRASVVISVAATIFSNRKRTYRARRRLYGKRGGNETKRIKRDRPGGTGGRYGGGGRVRRTVPGRRGRVDEMGVPGGDQWTAATAAAAADYGGRPTPTRREAAIFCRPRARRTRRRQTFLRRNAPCAAVQWRDQEAF